MVLSRFDADGALLWRRALKEYGPVGVSVAVAPAGAVYVAGKDSRLCETSWFLRRYRPNGDLLWQQRQKGCGPSVPVDLAATDHRVVVAGGDWADGWGTTDGWVRVFTPSGSLVWGKRLRVNGYGADPYTSVSGVAVGRDGAIYLGGSVASRSYEGAMPDIVAVLQKLSPRGSVVWTRTFPDRGRPDIDAITSVSVVGSRLLVAGRFDRVARVRTDVWSARLSLAGRTLWQRHDSSDRQWCDPTIAAAPGGGAILMWTIGVHDRDPGLIAARLAAGGQLVWRTVLGTWEAGGVAVDQDSIVLSGDTPIVSPYPRGRGRIWRFAT
jgi:hypothetical protein